MVLLLDTMEKCLNPAGQTQPFSHTILLFFASHVGITDNKDQITTLILYDGHKSNVNLTLTNRAKRYYTVLFVLHLILATLHNYWMKLYLGPSNLCIIKIAKCICKKNRNQYHQKWWSKINTRAISPENLVSAFRWTGIYPFNNTAILDSEVATATIYNVSQNASTESEHPDTPISVVSESTLFLMSSLVQLISMIQLLNLLNLLMTEEVPIIRNPISLTPKRLLQLSK